jgi:hypothetical protein
MIRRIPTPANVLNTFSNAQQDSSAGGAAADVEAHPAVTVAGAFTTGLWNGGKSRTGSGSVRSLSYIKETTE